MKLAILGCGQMGENILKGLLLGGAITAENTALTTKFDDHELELAARYPDALVTQDNRRALEGADLAILAVHPDAAKALLQEIEEHVSGKIVVSICAGIDTERLQGWAKDAVVVRAMPNTPCSIGEGIIVLSPASRTSKAVVTRLQSLFSPLGLCVVMDEKYMDIVTALASAGPAFAFVIMEALADGAVMMGLPRNNALKLTAQMVQGSARLQLSTGEHPAALKDQVTTPGGITTAGLLVMEDGGIRSTLARTIQKACGRSTHLLDK